MRTVCVLGAGGRLGSAVVDAFAQAGWQVLAQLRPGRAVGRGEREGVRWLEADPADLPTLRAASAGARVVVHAMNPPRYTAAAWSSEAPVLLEAGIALARALDAHLLFPGNVYPYGHGMPALLREDTPLRPDTPLGRVRADLEARLDQVAREGLAVSLIRAGDFFGAGRGSWFDRVLVKDLPRGRIVLPGGTGVATPWAYLPDLAQAFERLAAAGPGRGGGLERLHFEGQVLSGQAWVEALTAVARSRGWLGAEAPPRVGTLPWPLLRALGLAVPSLRAMGTMRYLWTTPHRLDGSGLRARIGAEPRTPLPRAVERTLADLFPDGGVVVPSPGPHSPGALSVPNTERA